MRSEHYSNKGLYAGYDKNHKERERDEYYSTPTQEVTNILETMKFDMNNCNILEPCVGGGHMLQGILDYADKIKAMDYDIYCSDIKDRGCNIQRPNIHYMGFDLDFFSDDYKTPVGIDYIIMNPPFSIIEPFVIRALEIVQKGLLMLGRIQFLEGIGRYEKILKDNPPLKAYVYVDRIKCYKNGDLNWNGAAVQCYTWYYWDKSQHNTSTEVNWIRRR